MKYKLETSKKTGMLKNLETTLRVLLLTTIVSVGMMGTTCAQATSESACERIKTVVHEDLMKQGKLSCDSAVLFLPARDNNNAFQQAQNLCIKLGAGMTEKDNNSTTYELSDGTGKIIIIDLKKDRNVFVVLYLKVHCDGFSVKEIRYISLKAYADLEQSEPEGLHSSNNHRQ